MQWSLASKDNKVRVQEVEMPPLSWWSFHKKYLDEPRTQIWMFPSFKGWKNKNLEPRMRVLKENGKETRRKWRLRACYHSLERRSLKDTCMKIERRTRKWIPLPPLKNWFKTMENEGSKFGFFWRSEVIRL